MNDKHLAEVIEGKGKLPEKLASLLEDVDGLEVHASLGSAGGMGGVGMMPFGGAGSAKIEGTAMGITAANKESFTTKTTILFANSADASKAADEFNKGMELFDKMAKEMPGGVKIEKPSISTSGSKITIKVSGSMKMGGKGGGGFGGF